MFYLIDIFFGMGLILANVIFAFVIYYVFNGNEK